MIGLDELSEKRIAVRCETEESAQEFLSAIFALFPRACRDWYDQDPQWGFYKEDTCYSVCRDSDDTEPTLYFSSCYDYEGDGFKIVNFNEVVFTTQDLGELDMSDADLLYLFGTEVPSDA